MFPFRRYGENPFLGVETKSQSQPEKRRVRSPADHSSVEFQIWKTTGHLVFGVAMQEVKTVSPTCGPLFDSGTKTR